MSKNKELVHSDKNQELYDCDSRLAQGFYTIREAVRTNHPGYDCQVIFGYRSPEEQFEMFKKGREWVPAANGGGAWRRVGRTVTNCDGYRITSDHNVRPSKAMDLMVVDSRGRAVWDRPYYLTIATYARLCGFGSGADWPSQDMGHVYIKPDIA